MSSILISTIHLFPQSRPISVHVQSSPLTHSRIHRLSTLAEIGAQYPRIALDHEAPHTNACRTLRAKSTVPKTKKALNPDQDLSESQALLSKPSLHRTSTSPNPGRPRPMDHPASLRTQLPIPMPIPGQSTSLCVPLPKPPWKT